jgi:cysteine sulfinate desulfinase/cysteine desulfurase-like protein
MVTLQDILSVAYREMVLNHSHPAQAIAMFKAASDDLIEEAKDRVARSQAIHPKKCFVTSKETEFLKAAIDSLATQSS